MFDFLAIDQTFGDMLYLGSGGCGPDSAISLFLRTAFLAQRV